LHIPVLVIIRQKDRPLYLHLLLHVVQYLLNQGMFRTKGAIRASGRHSVPKALAAETVEKYFFMLSHLFHTVLTSEVSKE
jgi:hypothetical protein